MAPKSEPTESELEILQILWEQGTSSVRDVNEILNQTRDTGYTTTLKIMQIMNEKGLVSRDTTQRTHLYDAAIPKESVQQGIVQKVIQSVFRGSGKKLIMQVLGQHEPTPAELHEIRTLIEEMEKSSTNQKEEDGLDD